MNSKPSHFLIQTLPCSHAELHEIHNPFNIKRPVSPPSSTFIKTNIHHMRQPKSVQSSRVLPKALEVEDEASIMNLCEDETIAATKRKADANSTRTKKPSLFKSEQVEEEIAPYITAYLDDILRSFRNILQLTSPTEKELHERKVSFVYFHKANAKKHSLLLDLDETLVHIFHETRSCGYSEREAAKKICRLEVIENGELNEYDYSIRPGMYKFLHTLAPYYDISVSFIKLISVLLLSQYLPK